MAMRADGVHRVTLDQVIETMRETGRDMQTRYKETALGGLALHVIEC
jgi:L-serine dehydratase